MLEENKRLKQELIDAENWEAEAQKYTLAEIGQKGAIAYVLKPEYNEGGPTYGLCPNCYQEKKKSILQRSGEARSGSLIYLHASVSNSGDEAMEEATASATKQTPGWTPVQVTTMAMNREVFAEMARKVLDS